MPASISPNRNLWIIAALVILAVAVLAWIIGSGADLSGNEIADVSVAPPGAVAGDGRAPAAGSGAGGN